jgi:hypothetical protein
MNAMNAIQKLFSGKNNMIYIYIYIHIHVGWSYI